MSADTTVNYSERFDKLDTQLDHIAMTVVKGFDRVDKALEEKASAVEMGQVLGLLDEAAKHQEISEDERLVMGHQLDRLDRWTHELAKKIGYELAT